MNSQPHQAGMIVNRSMPPGTIIPELVYNDLGTAVAWLCKTFGFVERLRIGNHRSQLVFGDASVVAVAKPVGQISPSPDVSEPPLSKGEVTHSLMVHVEDADRHYQRAKEAGARIVNPPTDYVYGERQYTAEDIAGRLWTFSQSIADVDPSEWLVPDQDS